MAEANRGGNASEDVDASVVCNTSGGEVEAGNDGYRKGEEANAGMTPTKSIICITTSLDSCLRHLRAICHRDIPGQSLTLWIDQICIAQSDSHEKGMQVGLMNQVYSRAEQVLVWLGPAASGSDEVMDAWIGMMGEVMQFFGSQDDESDGEIGEEDDGDGKGAEKTLEEDWENESSEQDGGGGSNGEGDEDDESEKEETNGKDKKGKEGDDSETSLAVDTDAEKGSRRKKTFDDLCEKGAKILAQLWIDGKLRAMFSRTWFTRVWVVQEACLCPNNVFVCGMKMVDYDILGFVGTCLFKAIADWKRKGGQLQGWDGNEHTERGGEIAGVTITRDPMSPKKYEDLMWSLAAFTALAADSNALRQSIQEIISNPEGGGRMPLLRLLVDLYGLDTKFLNKDAKLHRDRIFALLGLATDADQLGIRPDYSERTGTVTILTQVARAIIEKTKHLYALEILAYAQFPKTVFTDGNGEQLPSWVPDWRSGLELPFYGNTTRDEIDEDERDITAAPDTYTSCGTYRSVELLDTTSPGVLGLRGYLVDTIEEVGSLQCDPRKLDDEEEEYQRMVTEPFLSHLDRFWELSKQKDEPIYETAARREEALWRVPIVDTVSEAPKDKSSKSRASSDSALHYRQLRRLQEAVRVMWSSSDAESHAEVSNDAMQRARDVAQEIFNAPGRGALEYMQYFGFIVAQKTLYMTQKGYLGMGPNEMRAGDVVVVFPGARVPFVLRPTAEKDTFTYVGDAYCDGIMDGEITLREEKRNFFLV